MKKSILKIVTALLPIAIITSVYAVTPSKIVLPENARYSAFPNGFVRLNDTVDTSAVGECKVQAELFGALPIKTVKVSVVPERYVYVSGEVIGVRIYSDGIMVTDVEKNGAARAGGVKKGDIIKEVNGIAPESTERLCEMISEQMVNTFTIKRGSREIKITLRGKKTEQGYTVGMWVRDSAAGIGTMTYIAPDGSYGALGHAICDSDTEQIVPVSRGTLSSCKVSAVKAGKKGEPGEIIGSIGSEVSGSVLINSELGIYGKTVPKENNLLLAATRFLIKEGEAELWCNIDGEGIKSYRINIDRISKSSRADNKGMTITVTDPELLSKTNGIIQGMSGSPIIQNGKIVGAVTHVFVNDPTRGYGIFIENMLEEARRIK